MPKTLVPGLLLCLALPGCSSLVRSVVDTQPRVDVQRSAFETPDSIVKGEAVAYQPGPSAGDLDPDLLKHAPVIVQGFQPDPIKPHYDYNADAIGAPALSADGRQVHIDTDQPRVFARVERASVSGVDLKQLVYAFWYPSRPVGTIETGTIDGGVLRITLDKSGQPSVFEYTQPCGCFHGVFVSDALEADARVQFESVAPRRVEAVEPPLTGKDDWVVRDVIPVEDGGRLHLFVSAGKHFCEALCYRAQDKPIPTSIGRSYELAAYRSLDHLARTGGGEGSMFDADGRVIGAKRGTEQALMSDLDHAGWPRRLDIMLIHWDKDRWTDPQLLEKHLRLPQSLTGGASGGAAVAVAAGTIHAGQSIPASENERGRRLVLYTNKYCLGCQMTKKSIGESRRLRELMRGWKYEVVDTATDEGTQMAAEHRVTMVPVLIGYDGNKELFRTEDVDTPDKIAGAISRSE
jgi:hypothetical protein